MKAVWERYLGLKTVFRVKWSKEAKKQLLDEFWIDPRVGSETFFKLWKIEKSNQAPKSQLNQLLDWLGFEELTGDSEQLAFLLKRFHPNLAPDHPFWGELARLVDQSFPKDSLSEQQALAHQVHQLRYLISSQQAEYVRRHYRKGRMTEGEALARYLRKRTYRLRESARLHNKIKLTSKRPVFPDNQQSFNIKILQQFHTEFILSSQGRFLNELDREGQTEAGVVNGASFNYASRNNKRHQELDVHPVGPHDPQFRRLARKGFRAPSLLEYRDANSSYAYQGKSCLKHVQNATKALAKMIKKKDH